MPVILVANNMYDKLYMEGFIGRPVEFIPSICDYYGEYYQPQHDEFLYYYKGNLSEIKNPKIKSKNSSVQNSYVTLYYQAIV